MPGDRLDMALAVGASPETRAVGAVGPAALILPISLPVCCAVCQDLSLWADITVVVLIIYVLILLKKPIFCHRPFIRQQWQDTVREQLMGDRRRPVSGVHDDHLWRVSFYLIIQRFKSAAVMLIPGMDSIPQYPSVPVTGGLHGIGKDVFMFPFPKPATLWVSCAALAGPATITTGTPAGWRVITVSIL